MSKLTDTLDLIGRIVEAFAFSGTENMSSKERLKHGNEIWTKVYGEENKWIRSTNGRGSKNKKNNSTIFY